MGRGLWGRPGPCRLHSGAPFNGRPWWRLVGGRKERPGSLPFSGVNLHQPHLCAQASPGDPALDCGVPSSLLPAGHWWLISVLWSTWGQLPSSYSAPQPSHPGRPVFCIDLSPLLCTRMPVSSLLCSVQLTLGATSSSAVSGCAQTYGVGGLGIQNTSCLCNCHTVCTGDPERALPGHAVQSRGQAQGGTAEPGLGERLPGPGPRCPRGPSWQLGPRSGARERRPGALPRSGSRAHSFVFQGDSPEMGSGSTSEFL